MTRHTHAHTLSFLCLLIIPQDRIIKKALFASFSEMGLFKSQNTTTQGNICIHIISDYYSQIIMQIVYDIPQFAVKGRYHRE